MGKWELMATGDEVRSGVKTQLDDATLLKKMRNIESGIVELKQYYKHTYNPITVVKLDKSKSIMEGVERFFSLQEHIKF